MTNRIYITADDFGMTKGITDSILATADNGVLNSVSVLADGAALEYAMAEYKKRSDRLRLNVHLNLTAGPNSLGSFTSLWLGYILASSKKRSQIRADVSRELAIQIEKIRNLIGPDAKLGVDGHQHAHMLPFVFDELMKLSHSNGISFVRIPREPFYIAEPYGAYFSGGIIKHVLLNLLSKRNLSKMKDAGIETNDYVIGVLHTGRMNENAVEKGLMRISKIARNGAAVEVIFHPGSLVEGESAESNLVSDVIRWSLSPWRRKERQTLMSPRMKNVVMTFCQKYVIN